MAERPSGRGGTAPRATDDASRGFDARFAEFRAAMRAADRLSLVVAIAGALAALLLVIAEFSTIASVDIANGSCDVIASSTDRDRCALSGFERHGGALVLLGILIVVMAWGAGVGRSRPAALALVAAGAVAVGIGLLVDLPETDATGAIGASFEDAEGQAGPGLYLEILAGLLAAGAGALRLTRQPDL